MSTAKGPTAEELLVVIRAHCLQCSGGSVKEVERCGVQDCKLRPYRSVKVLGGEKKVKQKNGQVSLFEFMGVAHDGADQQE